MIDLGNDFKLKGGHGIKTFTEFGSIRDFISSLLPNIFVVAGLILILFIVGGGIGMITSAGNPEAQQKSKGVLTNAILGFIIIFTAYWIIQIIQVITGINILTG